VLDRAAYRLELCRYIVLNPVRARLVKAVGDWPWSCYQATIGRTVAPAWLVVDPLLQQFAPTREEAQAQYRQFVAAGVATAAPWEQLHGQMWLGDASFLARMDALIRDQAWAEVPVELGMTSDSRSWLQVFGRAQPRQAWSWTDVVSSNR
jgi:putative transposase